MSVLSVYNEYLPIMTVKFNNESFLKIDNI